jgi:hypothetical protein
MQMLMVTAAATVCLFLLRCAWRMLVEIPDARQVWVPDAVDHFLSRSLSASLLGSSGLFLALMAR